VARGRSIQAAMVLLAAALGAGCTGGAPTGGGGTITVTGCGGETVAVPAAGAIPSAACSSGPMAPTPSPFPVSDEAAVAVAERFTGEYGFEVDAWTADGAPAYLLTGAGLSAVVDGTNGRVLQDFVLAPDITNLDGGVPDWAPAPSPSPGTVRDAAAAIEVAQAWLARHGLEATTTGATARLDTLPMADAWRVTLTGDGRPVELRVSRAGDVVGYQVGDAPLVLSLPRLSRDAAISMAIARTVGFTGRNDEQLIAAEFTGALWPTEQVATWMITTGIPARDPSYGTVWSLGAAIEVDTLTGVLTVDKRG
jgi:hypothetical protein